MRTQIASNGEPAFDDLKLDLSSHHPENDHHRFQYAITVSTAETDSDSPCVVNEALGRETESSADHNKSYTSVFESSDDPWIDSPGGVPPNLFRRYKWNGHTSYLRSTYTALHWMAQYSPPLFPGSTREAEACSLATKRLLSSCRFYEWWPNALRAPTPAGIFEMGQSGENFSSVLKAIWDDDRLKTTALEWLNELVPVEFTDIKFEKYSNSQIQAVLIDKATDRAISIESVSDGTLRFLAMIAMLFGPGRPSFIFLEEIETGIHPTRLHLLVELLEHCSKEFGIQIVATTHSPQVLEALNERSRNDAVLVYRSAEDGSGRIKRLIEIDHAREMFEKRSPGYLHESGWFEKTLAFAESGDDD